MNRRLMTLLLGTAMTASLLLSGCAPKETDEEVQEKAPPDVIQLDPEAVRSAGIETLTVQARTTGSPIVTTGEVQANENRVFHINSFVSGRVIRDEVFLGDNIRQGQTLAVVQNLEVAKVQADYIHALHQNEIGIDQARTRYSLAQQNLERERRLLAEGISPRKDYQQAEADAVLARSELEGQKEHQIHIKAEGRALLGAYGMRPGSPHSERILTGSPVTAPRSGVITKKSVTLGDMVTPDTAMYEVADLSQIWLNVNVYPKDWSAVHLGQAVTFTTDNLPGKTFAGRINYIQPGVNEASQTYIARAYIGNPGGHLKPGMFGKVQVEPAAKQTKPFVPEVAVQKYGRETFVFVPLEQNRFHKQTIILGDKVGDGYLVNQGLQIGEKVIAKGSFTLKAEMLKSHFAED